ncbi:hypothetical protein AAVH_07836 [Aphelenchoides avenae]|nr:hypothetical protein AAVH_07836 [Aphelenchus avenae]
MSKNPGNAQYVTIVAGPPLTENPRDRCCCNTHVEIGARAIAVFGIVCTLLYLLANFHTTPNIFGSVVALVAYVCIFVAQQGRVPGLYLPFLILQGIGIVMYSLATSYLIFLFIAMPANYNRLIDDSYLQDPNVSPRAVIGVAAVFLFLINALNVWFELVVFRAYVFMKREQELPRGYVIQS